MTRIALDAASERDLTSAMGNMCNMVKTAGIKFHVQSVLYRLADTRNQMDTWLPLERAYNRSPLLAPRSTPGLTMVTRCD